MGRRPGCCEHASRREGLLGGEPGCALDKPLTDILVPSVAGVQGGLAVGSVIAESGPALADERVSDVYWAGCPGSRPTCHVIVPNPTRHGVLDPGQPSGSTPRKTPPPRPNGFRDDRASSHDALIARQALINLQVTANQVRVG